MGQTNSRASRLLVLRENGELMIAAATPTEFKPVARAGIMKAVVRSYPVIADGRLYARNERSLICVKLSK